MRDLDTFWIICVWAFIPDAPLDGIQWRLEVELKDMFESFEVIFHGLNAVGCNVT
jgi:hypothetical protein